MVGLMAVLVMFLWGRRKLIRQQKTHEFEMQNLDKKKQESPANDVGKPSSPDVPCTPDTDNSETQEGRAEGIEIEGMETAVEGGDNAEIIMQED